MKDIRDQISRLMPVLEMAFEAERLRMSGINRRIEVYKKQLSDIDRPPQPGQDPFAPSVRAGADMRWQTWAQERKKTINSELALVMREKETARFAMRAALSKLESARNLEQRAQAEFRLQSARRSSW